MAAFTAKDFRDMLQTDMWVIEQIQILPHDPPTETTSEYDEKTGITNHIVKFVTSISMPAQQEAVRQYRSKLSPVFFTIAQKVYAELFRTFLGQNGLSAGKNQVNIEEEIQKVMSDRTVNSMVFTPVFAHRADFDNWWKGEYNYKDLRHARNNIVHNQYTIIGDFLQVKHSSKIVLDWNSDTVLDFSQRVLAKANIVCAVEVP